MNIDKESLEKARELLQELKKLEDAQDVLGNYDAESFAVFSTLHNHYQKVKKEVSISMPIDVRKKMQDYILARIYAIKKELESL